MWMDYSEELKAFLKAASPPRKPPNLRERTGDKHCGNCDMFYKGRCWGFGLTEVDEDDVCDDWYQNPQTTPAGKPKHSNWQETVAKSNWQVVSDYYHVAPTVERDRIRQHGLQPSNPMNNPDWGSRDDWEERHGTDPQIPHGVYLWNKPGQAYQYAPKMEVARDTPYDIWQIPDRPVQQDPDVPFANYTPEPVMDPELLEGPEHRVWDEFNLPYEHQWNNYKPLGLNADTNPNYEDVWNQRVSTWQVVTDNYTNDSREWPDPYEPRVPSPGIPEPHGCTCKEGDKLHCPVHGMDPTEKSFDYTWAQPQNNPVGYPQDQPRNWQQAHSNVWKKADYYHVAPTTERSRIQQHGLQVADPYHEQSPETWATLHGPEFRPPSGVYGWDTMDKARQWFQSDPQRDLDDYSDVWSIPQAGAIPDPDHAGARVLPYQVNDPTLVEGPEDRFQLSSTRQAESSARRIVQAAKALLRKSQR